MLTDTAHKLLVTLLNDPLSGDLRVHGNGFIQIDLDSTHRLHIWHHQIPRQKVSTQVHNHRFSFHSTCLIGRIEQSEYDVTLYQEDGKFNIYVPTPNEEEDTKLIQMYRNPCTITETAYYSISAGESYTFDAGRFHETTYGQLSVTLMNKTSILENCIPQVLVKVGQEPDNDFNRYDYRNHIGVLRIYREALSRVREKERDGRL